jgi:hypothetical protein
VVYATSFPALSRRISRWALVGILRGELDVAAGQRRVGGEEALDLDKHSVVAFEWAPRLRTLRQGYGS